MSRNQSRVQAMNIIQTREPVVLKETQTLDELWAKNVFTLSTMQKVLPKNVFKSVKNTINTGDQLDLSVADSIANAMKDWAVARGAKYYAHVFYPLTGATAEKHDGFIEPQADGSVVSELSGKALVQGEPDGSSFPNGGLRATFEARGYTAWDVTSPAYLMDTANGSTLCIPTVFISWTGEALDKKTPLIRANEALNTSATRALKLLGYEDVARVGSVCGAEQEYFLIDSALASTRSDINLTGRTLFGAPSAKHQQFDDHYFGAIPERVQVYMQEVETELYILGIPAKTRHNEVAPGQFEIAPIFEKSNVATDHQQMIMTTLKNVAKRHNFTCLLHEKPFAGINGSGKHVNWSVSNTTQGNLLDPGKTPDKNEQFILFCSAVIRGVHKFGGLLRSAAASSSNDHRLGANEAPPAIISIYLGSQLEDMFNQIQSGKITGIKEQDVMDFGVGTLPEFEKDAGDRNRTSPFAFTGNRFEFRAVGSNQSVAGPLISMNTILADSLDWASDKMEAAIKGGSDISAAVMAVAKEVMDNHSAVIFGGDGYSQDWHKEAEKRGLRNLRTTADALPVLKEAEVIELFKSTNVLSPKELESRFEVYAEQYLESIAVEANVMVETVKTQIYPAAMEYLSQLSDTYTKLGSLKIDIDTSVAQEIVKNTDAMMKACTALETVKDEESFDSIEAHLQHTAQKICVALNEVRTYIDALEEIVADDMWPLPTYEEMLFIK
ncbi:MAG: glutamine synthetase III [Fibrobacterales bacterium]